MNAKKVSAVIPTRGDVDLDPVLNSLPFDDVIVWDNSKRENMACYGRFTGVAEAKHPLIYTQDDDVLVPIAEMLRRYNTLEPGVYGNRPPDETWRFLGVGALFPREAITGVFDRYLEVYGFDADFCRVADVVFAYQRPYRPDWLGYAELPWSRADNRMYLQHDHMPVRERARARTAALPERIEWQEIA